MKKSGQTEGKLAQMIPNLCLNCIFNFKPFKFSINDLKTFPFSSFFLHKVLSEGIQKDCQFCAGNAIVHILFLFQGVVWLNDILL